MPPESTPNLDLGRFREVWLIDFEFQTLPGERPSPLCLAAREFRSGRTLRFWADDLERRRDGQPPYAVDSDALIVAYYASAEMSCHLALGWPLPIHVLDLYAEFRRLTNGLTPICGSGLLGALAWHGLDCLPGIAKEQMRRLAMRGGSYTEDERSALLDYCESDVSALARLLSAMEPDLDLPRALLRGRYMKAAARMEWEGIPIDSAMLGRLREGWTRIQDELIRSIDERFGVFEGRSFKASRWADWATRNNLPWPRLASGGLALDEDTFRQMARVHADVALMRELRHSLSQLRLADLAVGSDGRNRTLLSAFRSKTGRNQPSNSQFIFGPSVWLRGLIKPSPGRALAYIDWSQQEFGIGAALSGDGAMMEAYNSGDPYLAFGKQAGQIPPHATKDTHQTQRDSFKTCALGVQYGMGEHSLADRIGKSVAHARELISLHRQTYPKFWAWSDGAETHVMLLNQIETVFGWRLQIGREANPRSIRNFPCQANGAEMLRLACCLATERGLKVVAPIHDAIMIEADTDAIEQAVAETQEAMAEASEIVLAGFRLHSDVKIIAWPDRYMDERGKPFWDRVSAMLP